MPTKSHNTQTSKTPKHSADSCINNIKEYSELVSRINFSKINVNCEQPDLLDIQKKSYENFLKNEIENVIAPYFPMSHAKNTKYEVVYKGINIEKPTKTEEQCRLDGSTYASSLFVNLELINNDTGEIIKAKAKKGAKNKGERGVFFADIPLMTTKGTFIINGTEKIVISQLVRSPGAYIYNATRINKSASSWKAGYFCELYPSRGTDVKFQSNDEIGIVDCIVRSSAKGNTFAFHATLLLKAFGLNEKAILEIYRKDTFIEKSLAFDEFTRANILEDEEVKKLRNSLLNKKNAGQTISTGSPIENKLKNAIIKHVELSEKQKTSNSASLQEQINACLDVIVTEKCAKKLVSEIGISTKTVDSILKADSTEVSFQDLLLKRLMDKKSYDLTSAGRYKIDHKFKISERLYGRILAEDIHTKSGSVLFKKGTLIGPDELKAIKAASENNEIDCLFPVSISSNSKVFGKQSMKVECISVYVNNEKQESVVPVIGIVPGSTTSTALVLTDFIAAISYTIGLPAGIGQYDDVEHLANKRLRLIHEQLLNKLNVGMARVEKFVKDKLASITVGRANEEQVKKIEAKATLNTIVNTKAFDMIVKQFFNQHQLTQFVDQQNPLSELTNKRRISAMGEGGISRDDPNLDVRDIHPSYYGRICPIESPEGLNIGLILSLASWAKVDKHGFITAPYKKVKNGVITDEIEYLTASKEDDKYICEATVKTDAHGKILDKRVTARYRLNQEIIEPSRVDYADILPSQILSISTSAIPFMNSNDGVRSMYGSNMERQALPLLQPKASIVGTGVEYKVAHDSGMAVVAEESGVVDYVDGNKIVIKRGNAKDTYKLVKFRRSNQDTCINQTPIVHLGQQIEKGKTIADGPAMENGELALGRNVLVAFTTWNGYNFEDAIVISDRLVHEDSYTSISIQEYEVAAVRTKTGDEEITRDLQNTSEDAKRYLDDDGIILVGAEVKEGDILVGKISPKGSSGETSEEKLLRSIFGSKSKNFRDSSLKVPHGGEGIVAKIEKFSTAKGDQLEDDVIEKIKIYIVQKRKIQVGDKLAGRHGNKGVISIVVPVADMPHLADGTPIDVCLNPQGVPSRMNIGQIYETYLGAAMRQMAKNKLLEYIFGKHTPAQMMTEFGMIPAKVDCLLKCAKSYMKDSKISSYEAAEKKISDADLQAILKLAGMTFEDISLKAATPVFSGATKEDVICALSQAGFDTKDTENLCKETLYDGRTGEEYGKKITVGVMHVMKLDHMVDDKVHARATGPYSKITQQPLGGKSQNGGQKFGEMEVWALEAYGAAYNLRECLTIKSDDITGRELTYSAIIKGRPLPETNIPESFKLMTKQLQGLCLSVDLIHNDGTTHDANDITSVTDEEDANTIDSDLNTGVLPKVEIIDSDDEGVNQ